MARMPRTALRVLPALLLLLAGCGRSTWVVPPAPAGTPALHSALEDAFARAAARREADYREIVAPGSNERALADGLSARDLEAWVRAGEELFVRDVRTGPINPLRRAGAGEQAVADATRCAGCHHRGGQAGAGSYADLDLLRRARRRSAARAPALAPHAGGRGAAGARGARRSVTTAVRARAGTPARDCAT